MSRSTCLDFSPDNQWQFWPSIGCHCEIFVRLITVICLDCLEIGSVPTLAHICECIIASGGFRPRDGENQNRKPNESTEDGTSRIACRDLELKLLAFIFLETYFIFRSFCFSRDFSVQCHLDFRIPVKPCRLRDDGGLVPAGELLELGDLHGHVVRDHGDHVRR